MFKRINRTALSVVISLAVAAGIYTSVLGASFHHTGAIGGGPHVTAGLLPDLSHLRTGITSLNDYYSDSQAPAHSGCHGDAIVNQN